MIGIFDSGAGGLSVLREIRRELPLEDCVYFADNAFCPYGEKSRDFIVLRAKTITEFLLRLRIFIATTLLDGTVYPVNLIAERCGMNTPSYFGVVFKKATGMTPEGYRRQRVSVRGPI